LEREAAPSYHQGIRGGACSVRRHPRASSSSSSTYTVGLRLQAMGPASPPGRRTAGADLGHAPPRRCRQAAVALLWA
jgi:hypothetical protein